jgi:hypothetical protein
MIERLNKAYAAFRSHCVGHPNVRYDAAWEFFKEIKWDSFTDEDWKELRLRALANWDEANKDREGLRDGLKASTIFGSALITSILGIAKANLADVSSLSMVALALAGIGTSIAFMTSGTVTAPARPSVRLLMQGGLEGKPIVKYDVMNLYAQTEEFRECLNHAALRDWQAKALLASSVAVLLIEAVIIVVRHA